MLLITPVSSLLALTGILIIFLLSILFIAIVAKRHERRTEEIEEYIVELDDKIHFKEQYIAKLNNQIHSRTIDKNVQLSNAEITILNIYEQSHIRIPADIIEELSFMKLTTEKEILDYIENQRNYWKLENTKRAYKGALNNGH